MARIGIIAENSVAYVQTLIHIWSELNTAVLIDWRMPSAKITELLTLAGVQECYSDKKHINEIRSRLNLPVKLLETDVSFTRIPTETVHSFQERYSDDEAVIFFSSGTTGNAKGIVLSHYTVNTNADAVIEYMNLGDEDSIYIVKTLAHSSTLVCELLVGLKRKIDIFVSPTLVSPTKAIANINKAKATVLCVNPTLLSLYVLVAKSGDRTVSCLKSIYVSGAILDKNAMAEARAVFPSTAIYNIYGLTEAGPRVCAQTQENYEVKGTVGKPVRNVCVRVVGSGNRYLSSGEEGKIQVKTWSIGKGYLNTSFQLTEDGYLDTGDIGYQDDYGNIYVCGRADDMIIRGAHNVFPQGVEEAVKFQPMVDDCLVFGTKDKLYGEKMICFYTAQAGEIPYIDLIKHCKSYLADYEVPTEFIRMENLPVTPGGKKSRLIARKIYEGESSKGVKGEENI